MFIIFGFFFMIGGLIILGFLLLIPISIVTKRKGDATREVADEIISQGKGDNDEINELIDRLTAIKDRRMIPFTEADRVRIDKLRLLRKA